MDLSVVIPVYDEAATLEELVRRVRAVEIEKEILLVDDGSTDGSRAILERLEREPGLRVLYHDRNRGKGAALRLGLAHAKGDVVLLQDADLEYDPADYEKLIAPIREGRADVVLGSRFASGTSHGGRYMRHRMGNRLLTGLSNLLTGLDLTDVETGYKAFRSEVVQSFTIEEERFGVEPEIAAKVAKGQWRVCEVPISYTGRSYAEGKKIGWRDGIRAVVSILKYNLR